MKDYIEEYIDINGIKQYFLHYPIESEFVILYLHGGPGQTEAHFAYYERDERLKCNIVYYDQRGTGKTQLKNKTKPEDITMNILIEDLKETVLYVKERYNTEKIILLGHSWGSILGICYIKENPFDVICYIGTGQIVDMMKNEKIAYDKLLEIIQKRGTPKQKKVFSKFKGYPYDVSRENFIKTILGFRKLQGKFGLTGDAKQQIKVFSRSPIFHLTDLYPLLTCIKTNKNLFDTMFTYNFNDDTDYNLPVFFICGRNDWQTPSVIVEEYFSKIKAPKKGLYWVEGAGHLALLDNPKGYNDALLKVIKEL